MTHTFFTKEHLTSLDTALMALPQTGLPMTISELNGFLTGILVNPESIQPSLWLPKIWGDDPVTAFDAMVDPELTTELIIDHYNILLKMLKGNARYEPVLKTPDQFPEEKPWMPWVEGFMKSIELAPLSWDVLTPQNNKNAETALEVLYLMDDMASNASVFPKQRVETVTANAPELISNCVNQLNKFTRSLKAAQASIMVDVPEINFTDNVIPFSPKSRTR